MILRVGPFLYRVHFADQPIHHQGHRCLGLCDNETHEIFVYARISFSQQIQVICHEYMEAWLYQFGEHMDDKEGYCDLFGMAMTQFVLDLVRQLDHLARTDPQPCHEDAGHAMSAVDAQGTAAASLHNAGATGCLPADACRTEPPDQSPRVDDRHHRPTRSAKRTARSSAAPKPACEPAARRLAAKAARLGLQVSHVHDP